MNLGFISTRFAGTDGVSLETEKWVEVLQQMGHTCFYFSGQSDRPTERSSVVPEAFFGHSDIHAINLHSFGRRFQDHAIADGCDPDLADLPPNHAAWLADTGLQHKIRSSAVTRRIKELTAHLKTELRSFVKRFEIQVLIPQNALAIPMNIPLGLALTEFLAETGLPTIAHHHDLHWERQRFSVNCVSDYLQTAFPPNLPSICHVVLSSSAAHQLSMRCGLGSVVIPNVMDFDAPPGAANGYCSSLRRDLGLSDNEVFLLQPTRVVQRKGIEHSIELAKRLNMPARLVISHASGDEGDHYEHRIREFARLLDVPVTFVVGQIAEKRGLDSNGQKIYTLSDAYLASDLVLYPSLLEGFGNAFLEAIYFRRPLLVHRYPVYCIDIKPCGFQVVEFSEYLTENTIAEVQRVLQDPHLQESMTAINFTLAKRYFSYDLLRSRLQSILNSFFGSSGVS